MSRAAVVSSMSRCTSRGVRGGPQPAGTVLGLLGDALGLEHLSTRELQGAEDFRKSSVIVVVLYCHCRRQAETGARGRVCEFCPSQGRTSSIRL